MTSPLSGNAEAAEALARAELPVLMLDTCVFLDVVRAPVRREVRNATVSCAVSLAASLAAGHPMVSTVVASLVPKEFDENLARVSGELRGHCQRLIEQARDADFACAAIGSYRSSGFHADAIAALGDQLPGVARRLIDSATILSADMEIRARSQLRVIQERPPSAQGKESKDPQIFEEYLDLARRLRVSGFTAPIVFCSSDRAAYCQGGPTAHPELAAELDDPAVRVKFTSNLPWAWHELGLGPLSTSRHRQ